MEGKADLSISNQLKNVIQHALNHSFSIASWRLPQSEKILISLTKNAPITKDINIELEEPGFYASPFINPNLKNTLFFKSDELYTLENGILKNQNGDSTSFTPSNYESTFYFHEISNPSTSSSDYKNQVSQVLEGIKNTDFKKVVISKIKTKEKPAFDIIDKYLRLIKEYPNAFVSLLTSSVTGTWLGATPETLISINKSKIFKTVALAGTQAYQSQPIKSAVWTQKEIEEQSFVSKYIVHCFKSLRLREFEDIGPKTVRAANLLHLKTEFLVDLKEVDFPSLGSQMSQLLHPTSAVCGTPKNEALSFINKHEAHDRELFTGFIGPVNIKQETHLFVNLRCMKIGQDKMTYYAGAGLTEDSNPEKEWEETEYKCQTLESIIEND